MSITLTVRVTFDAAHYLPDYQGKCKYEHGHTYTAVARLQGKVDEKTGMVADFGKIKKILTMYDHDSLNNPARGGVPIKNPTVENLATILARRLKELENVEEVELTVYETPDCAVSVRW